VHRLGDFVKEIIGKMFEAPVHQPCQRKEFQEEALGKFG
jgi:hypothetical protein